MGAIWTRGTPNILAARLRNIEGDLMHDFGNEADQIAREAADHMKNYIATRGTAKSGKAGRIETGTMLGDVGYEVRIGKGVSMKIGWTEGARLPYFLYQEGGFTHYLSGEHIEGMFALRDASEEAKGQFLKAAADALDHALRSLK